MTDIHSHIIEGVDDGAKSRGEALHMLRTASESGVVTVAATPHYDRAAGYPRCTARELEDRFSSLCRQAARERIPVSVVRGMEIMAEEELPELLSNGEVWTLNGSARFLAEFPFRADPAACGRVLRRCAARGFMPVIAHPERYIFIQDEPQIAYEWCRSGYALQLNRGSLLGRFGEEAKHTALRLIGHGLAACAASDAHGASRRTARMDDVYRLLEREFGSDHAELLTKLNPARILTGRELMGFEPYPFK